MNVQVSLLADYAENEIQKKKMFDRPIYPVASSILFTIDRIHIKPNRLYVAWPMIWARNAVNDLPTFLSLSFSSYFNRNSIESIQWRKPRRNCRRKFQGFCGLGFVVERLSIQLAKKRKEERREEKAADVTFNIIWSGIFSAPRTTAVSVKYRRRDAVETRWDRLGRRVKTLAVVCGTVTVRLTSKRQQPARMDDRFSHGSHHRSGYSLSRSLIERETYTQRNVGVYNMYRVLWPVEILSKWNPIKWIEKRETSCAQKLYQQTLSDSLAPCFGLLMVLLFRQAKRGGVYDEDDDDDVKEDVVEDRVKKKNSKGKRIK